MMSAKINAILTELRAFGLSYPGAHRKSPWTDHDDLAVNDKTFAYLPGSESDRFTLGVKLPFTHEQVLDLPFATPTPYGLGKAGWVSLAPAEDEIPPIGQLKDWLDQSYRAQAPKRLVKELDAREGVDPAAPR
jgi:predicted DNA-binding protein (MmcQ/YjbR family)